MRSGLPKHISEDARVRNPDQMPWPVMAAGLTAIGGLYLTAGPTPLLILAAVCALISYAFRARLEGGTFLRWIVRIAYIAAILMLNQAEPTTGDYALGSARIRNIFGQLYAAEFALQCWRSRPGTPQRTLLPGMKRGGFFWWRRNQTTEMQRAVPADPARSALQALFASGMLMLTASNTFDERWTRFVAPLYLLFVGLAFAGYRARPRITTVAAVAHGIAVFVALSVGAIGYRTFVVNRGNLTEWGNRFLNERLPFDTTGMASQPTLGETFGLRGSNVRALRITNFAGDAHLRGMTFDSYDSGTWGPPASARSFRAARETEILPPPVTRTGPTQEMRVTRLIRDSPLLFAPLQTAGIDKGEAQSVDWAPQDGGPFRVRQKPPYEYGVTVVDRETYQGLLAPPVTKEDRARYEQIPQNFDPRLRDLARQITKNARTDAQKAEAITGYLILNHPYSLTIRPGTSDPLVGFLLSTPKKGAHCEYFAASAAMLLRCVGVPSRYCTGYLAHEGDNNGNTIVRQRDAHAWCEAWINGVGWVTVDATPGAGRPDENSGSIEPWRRVSEWFTDRLGALGDWIAAIPAEQVNLGLALIVTGFVLFFALRYLARRRRVATLSDDNTYSPPPPDMAELLARFESAFARKGMLIAPQRTYRQQIETAPETLRVPARRFVDLYERARWGSENDTQTRQEMSTILNEIEHAA